MTIDWMCLFIPGFLLYVYLDDCLAQIIFLQLKKSPRSFNWTCTLLDQQPGSTLYKHKICPGLNTVFFPSFCLDDYAEQYFHSSFAWTIIKPHILFFHLKGISWYTQRPRLKIDFCPDDNQASYVYLMLFRMIIKRCLLLRTLEQSVVSLKNQ